MGGDEPIRGRDRINKDSSLVKKLNVMANIMSEIEKEQLEEPK